MTLFLLATFAYRFANGLLFLAVAWNIVRSADGGAMPLALSAISGFLPAVIASPFARRLLARVDTCALTLWGMAGLAVCALVFIPFRHVPFAILAINFAVLSIFFLLEGAWDALLAVIVSRVPRIQGDRLNSRQSAATQAGLMLGGLPLGLLVRFGGSAAPFIGGAALYVVTLLLFALPTLRRLTRRPDGGESRDAQAASALDVRESGRPPAWTTLATLALVWPCLTLINMLVPLVANTQGHGTVEHAALLDAGIGLGMASVGIAYEKLMALPARVHRHAIAAAIVLIPLPFIVLLALPYWLPLLVAAFFLCGIGFGMLRVTVRKQLIATQPAHRVGQIVASCNAYGFPILATLALLYARSWELGPFVPLAAFFAMAVIGGTAIRSRPVRLPVRSRATSDVG